MNPNFINTLEIEYFKSIRHSGKLDCNRINVFIGRPNVGKSNVLEAIALLQSNISSELLEVLRFEKVSEFFYKKEITKERVKITADEQQWLLNWDNGQYFHSVTNIPKYEFKIEHLNDNNLSFDRTTNKYLRISDFYSERISLRNTNHTNLTKTIKYYLFSKNIKFEKSNFDFLIPPYGRNIIDIIRTNQGLREELSSIFKEYDLTPVIDSEENKFYLVKHENGVGIHYPYILIADTLQRYLFHFAAIANNEKSILLFEEPEAHCFYEYVQRIAEKMLESKSNQFFLTTHSPDVLLTLLENDLKNEVSVFHVTYEDEQSKISKLSGTKLREMMDNGSSILANLENFDVTA